MTGADPDAPVPPTAAQDPRPWLVIVDSLIVAPHLAGTDDGHPEPLLAGPAPAGAPLRLTGVEQLRDGHLWLRYSTRAATT